ncbi:hypothetical protein N8659_01710 [bacterium]|nr:hypothetical protein [bacterium]
MNGAPPFAINNPITIKGTPIPRPMKNDFHGEFPNRSQLLSTRPGASPTAPTQ